MDKGRRNHHSPAGQTWFYSGLCSSKIPVGRNTETAFSIAIVTGRLIERATWATFPGCQVAMAKIHQIMGHVLRAHSVGSRVGFHFARLCFCFFYNSIWYDIITRKFVRKTTTFMTSEVVDAILTPIFKFCFAISLQDKGRFHSFFICRDIKHIQQKISLPSCIRWKVSS